MEKVREIRDYMPLGGTNFLPENRKLRKHPLSA